MTTEPNITTHNLTAKKLSFKQKMAIDLLLQGLSDREVADKIGVRRETVNVWRNHNPAFQSELERARRELFGDKTEEVNDKVEAVRATELLSLAGIRARLRFKDWLILQDISSYNEKRTRLIQRLEADIEQTRAYLDKVTEEEIVDDQISEYKYKLLQHLDKILNDTVASEAKREILTQLKELIED